MRKLFLFSLSMLILFCGCSSQSIPQEEEEPAVPHVEIDGENYNLDNLPENASYNPDEDIVYITPTTVPPEETVIPDAVNIDADATPLDSFGYAVFEDRAVITDFTGTETEIIVPSHIGDYPVTEIGDYAFEAGWNITSITLPDSITKISEQAFADCESLTSVNIPDGVTFIGRGAFSNCLALTELIIPASVTDTQEEMLTGCAVQDLYIYNDNLTYNDWGLNEDCTIHAANTAAIINWAYQCGYSFVEE